MKRYGGMNTHKDTKAERTYVVKITPLKPQKCFAWGLATSKYADARGPGYDV